MFNVALGHDRPVMPDHIADVYRFVAEVALLHHASALAAGDHIDP